MMDIDEALEYKSFKEAERFFDAEYKAGKLTAEQTRRLINTARENYRSHSLRKLHDADRSPEEHRPRILVQ